MSLASRAVTSNRFWVGVFGLWTLLLSGVLAGVVGSPGLIQSISLKALLESKQRQVDQIQTVVIRLQDEAEALQKDRIVQQREIRRVLGYAAPDEMIFDFSPGPGL